MLWLAFASGYVSSHRIRAFVAAKQRHQIGASGAGGPTPALRHTRRHNSHYEILKNFIARFKKIHAVR
ncbi:hypothetical protein [Hydrogenophaga borbori]|uniref:hypothetical protein n=1 Tax=Hydrogenophaga borbori TaxID=2294117 RepID=UPI0015F2A319|nr:hypothetical protein [Hydrogenophaga borbori]